MNIIEMAQECQLIGMRPHLDGIYQEALEKFAALVTAHEREECAKFFDDNDNNEFWGSQVATLIRERETT